MKRMLFDIVRNNRGESLVESVVAFLIITIALLSFAGMAVFASNMNMNAGTADQATEDPYTSYKQGTVTAGSTTYNVAESSNTNVSSYSTRTRLNSDQIKKAAYWMLKVFFYKSIGNDKTLASEATKVSVSHAAAVQAALEADNIDIQTNMGWAAVLSPQANTATTKYLYFYIHYGENVATVYNSGATQIDDVYIYRIPIDTKGATWNTGNGNWVTPDMLGEPELSDNSPVDGLPLSYGAHSLGSPAQNYYYAIINIFANSSYGTWS